MPMSPDVVASLSDTTTAGSLTASIITTTVVLAAPVVTSTVRRIVAATVPGKHVLLETDEGENRSGNNAGRAFGQGSQQRRSGRGASGGRRFWWWPFGRYATPLAAGSVFLDHYFRHVHHQELTQSNWRHFCRSVSRTRHSEAAALDLDEEVTLSHHDMMRRLYDARCEQYVASHVNARTSQLRRLSQRRSVGRPSLVVHYGREDMLRATSFWRGPRDADADDDGEEPLSDLPPAVRVATYYVTDHLRAKSAKSYDFHLDSTLRSKVAREVGTFAQFRGEASPVLNASFSDTATPFSDVAHAVQGPMGTSIHIPLPGTDTALWGDNAVDVCFTAEERQRCFTMEMLKRVAGERQQLLVDAGLVSSGAPLVLELGDVIADHDGWVKAGSVKAHLRPLTRWLSRDKLPAA